MVNEVNLQELLDRIIGQFIAEPGKGPLGQEIAQTISYSPAQTNRIFRRRFDESPAHFRRRLILERAAERLQYTSEPIWKISLESGFCSSEPFLRAFRKSFQVTPSRYRTIAGAGTWLATPSNLHYWRGTIVSSVSKGETTMNLTDRMIDHNIWMTGAMLMHAQNLSDKQLDEKLDQPFQFTFFESADQSLRDLFDGLVLIKEAWMSAMYNRPWKPPRDKSISTLIERWQAVEPDFRKMFENVANENRWDDLFVDALCCPPETFSFGSVFAHILTVDAARRAMALRELRKHGVENLRWGCPIEWERQSLGAKA